jgi:hypothetical protein
MNKETLEEVSPIKDLLEDLKETKVSVKESIDIIKDERIRGTINLYVQTTLDNIITRIENELLEKESKWQQEQDKNKYKYSKEDMELAFIAGGNSNITEDDGYGSRYIKYMDKWFEQFKKKL